MTGVALVSLVSKRLVIALEQRRAALLVTASSYAGRDTYHVWHRWPDAAAEIRTARAPWWMEASAWLSFRERAAAFLCDRDRLAEHQRYLASLSGPDVEDALVRIDAWLEWQAADGPLRVVATKGGADDGRELVR